MIVKSDFLQEVTQKLLLYSANTMLNARKQWIPKIMCCGSAMEYGLMKN